MTQSFVNTPTAAARPDRHAIGAAKVDHRKLSKSDIRITRLFCAWVFLQCFFYQALPALRLEVGIAITPDRFAFGAVLLAYMVRRVRFGGDSRPRAAIERILAASLLLFAFVGTASWWVWDADANNAKFVALVRLCNLYLLPAVSYFIARNIRYDNKVLKEVLVFLGVLGVYLGITAIGEHFEAASLVFPKYILDPTVGIQFGRSRGPFADTIGMGGMLLLCFLALVCLSSMLSGLKRSAALVAVLMVVAGVYFTETRVNWLGLAGVMVTIAVLRTDMRKTSIAVGWILIIGVLGGVGTKFSMYQPSLFAQRQNTVDYRLDNYSTAWTAFKTSPFVGIGYGNFDKNMGEYFDSSTSRYVRHGIDNLDDGNHSTPLGILADLGLAGFVPFVTILGSSALLCFGAYRRLRQEAWKREREFAVIGLCVVLVFALQGTTNDMKSVGVVSMAVFWLVGIASSIYSTRLASLETANDTARLPGGVLRKVEVPRRVSTPSAPNVRLRTSL